MSSVRESRITIYGQALARFATWFNGYRKPDGSLNAASLSCPAYMPVPFYAHATGDPILLHRTLRYIGTCAEQDPQFLLPPGRDLLSYRMAWFTMGAMLGEDLRLARSLEQQLLSFQEPRTGGFFGREDDCRAGEGGICFDSTANACAALCFVGNDAAAAKAGDYLRQLVGPQLDSGQRLLCGWHSRHGLITTFDPKQARSYSIDPRQPLQYLYKIGLLVRAFAFLYSRNGDAADLKLARAVQEWAITSSPDVWSNTLAHKLGWSAWTLFAITGDTRYLEQACRMADRLVTLQQPEGAFHYPEYWPPYEQVDIQWKLNIGCQFATWIAYARTMLGNN